MEMVLSPGTPSSEGEGHRESRGGGGEAAPCTADLADLSPAGPSATHFIRSRLEDSGQRIFVSAVDFATAN